MLLTVIIAIISTVLIMTCLYLVVCGVSFLVLSSADKPLTSLEAEVVKKEISPRLAFVGLTRDAMQGMPTLRRMHEAFQPALMFLMENNSQDGTRAYLEAWQSDDARVVVRSPIAAVDTARQTDHSKRRIERMISLRNQCMEQFWSLCRERGLQPDVVMIIDPDLPLQIDFRDLATAIRYVQTHDVSALSPNVLVTRRLVPFSRMYRDPFAFVELPDRAGVRPKKDQRSLRPVLSAFGIFTLYKNNSTFRSTKYAYSACDHDSGTECEHVDFHRRLAQTSGFPVMFAPDWKVGRRQWV